LTVDLQSYVRIFDMDVNEKLRSETDTFDFGSGTEIETETFFKPLYIQVCFKATTRRWLVQFTHLFFNSWTNITKVLHIYQSFTCCNFQQSNRTTTLSVLLMPTALKLWAGPVRSCIGPMGVSYSAIHNRELISVIFLIRKLSISWKLLLRLWCSFIR